MRLTNRTRSETVVVEKTNFQSQNFEWLLNVCLCVHVSPTRVQFTVLLSPNEMPPVYAVDSIAPTNTHTQSHSQIPLDKALTHTKLRCEIMI